MRSTILSAATESSGKLAAYVILGINCEGKKDVLTIEVGENESAKYWLAVLERP